MSSVGGDIIEIQFNHPTLGSGILFPKAGEDNTFDLGGFRADDSEDGITGSGDMILKLNRKRWGFECTVASDMNVRQDMEKLNNLSGNPVLATWTISHVNGSVYKGLGTVVGDVKGNGNAATIALKVAGGNKLTKII